MEYSLPKILFVLIIYSSINSCSSQFQILEGLKDAVLNAEGIVSDVFKSFDSVVKHMKFSKDFLKDSVEEECIFSCPDGSSPKKNKYYKATGNGCGVPGMELTDFSFLPANEMTKCCDRHDICYGTCSSDKDKCDLDFKKCLYRLCDDPKKKMTETESTGCKGSAKALYTGTTVFGCKFYKLAQEEGCYCPPPSKKFTGDEF